MKKLISNALLAIIAFLLVAIVYVTFFHNPANAAQTYSATDTRDAYAPFEELIQITASDVTEYDPPLRGCIIEVAGDLAVNTVKGDAAIGASDVVITVSAGQLIPAIMDQILATGTTATIVCGR